MIRTPPADFQTIRKAPDGETSCSSCTYWAKWLPATGDCMAYAYKRQSAIVSKSMIDPELWPPTSAPCTFADWGCEHYEKETD